MSRLSKKRQNFNRNQQLENLPVTYLPGIGNTFGARLQQAGYTTAESVYQEYLNNGNRRNQIEFLNWFKETCRIYTTSNDRWIIECFKALQHYYQFGGLDLR